MILLCQMLGYQLLDPTQNTIPVHSTTGDASLGLRKNLGRRFLMVDMVPVVSSNVESIGYDDAAGCLYIKFRTTPETYMYQNVPRPVFEELMAADSKGSYVNRNITPIFRDYQKI
jgi:hypothetical protein